MKVTKIEENLTTFGYDVEINDSDITVKLHIHKNHYTQTSKWIRNIFNPFNTKDMLIKDYQENVQNYIKCSCLAFEAVEQFNKQKI